MHFLAVFLLAAPLLAQAKSKCQGLVWSVDEKLNMCLAKHCCKATKGDLRSYPDLTQCSQYLMMDHFSCGGGVDHLGACKGPPGKGPNCPAGQSCAWGPFGFGFCCDEKNEAVWSKEYAAECKAPLKTVGIPHEDIGRKIVLFGKSCKDAFCPKGAKCVQGKYLAHCCV